MWPPPTCGHALHVHIIAYYLASENKIVVYLITEHIRTYFLFHFVPIDSCIRYTLGVFSERDVDWKPSGCMHKQSVTRKGATIMREGHR